MFVAPIHYAKVMAAAEYRLREKRQRQTRKPSNLPKEDELGKLLTFIEAFVDHDNCQVAERLCTTAQGCSGPHHIAECKEGQ